MKTSKTVYDIINEKIFSELEQGVIPWHKPWKNFDDEGNFIPPQNFVSKIPYKGINFILLLNRSSISSKQECLDILKAFNLEIYQSGKGQSVLIKDGEGNTLRHPINMSDFTERADVELTLSNKPKPDPATQQVLQDKTKQVLQGLIKEYRFFTADELRKAFLRQELIPYKITKNGNYNIYSPTDKTVVDAQFRIKKYSVRLKNFALSNDQFYAIIKDYTERLLSEHRNIAEALLDTKKSTLKPN